MLNSVPEEIRQKISLDLNLSLVGFSFSGGGCINHGGRLRTSSGDHFLKWNSASRFPGMFEAEAKGLKLLRQPNLISIPEVILVGESGDWQFIVMSFIESQPESPAYWDNLGRQLASLHRLSAKKFGLDHDNYIGSLPQVNTARTSWIEFFIDQRLETQIKLAVSTGRADKKIAQQFEMLYKKLPEIFPEEKPALLHGDLWSGNLITDSAGNPCLIDPAAYYGHREAEIAFTTLFGGFSRQFYDSYHKYFPLEPGFNQRSQVYNLYPLMVHLNLFGGGYLSQVVSILRHFV